jgi:hypothetical protein
VVRYTLRLFLEIVLPLVAAAERPAYVANAI